MVKTVLDFLRRVDVLTVGTFPREEEEEGGPGWVGVWGAARGTAAAVATIAPGHSEKREALAAAAER